MSVKLCWDMLRGHTPPVLGTNTPTFQCLGCATWGYVADMLQGFWAPKSGHFIAIGCGSQALGSAGACDQGGGLLTTHPKPATRCACLRLFSCPLRRFKRAWAPASGMKKPQAFAWGLGWVGGPKRIRTAVAAFAELSLATRPSDRLCGFANIRKQSIRVAKRSL